MPEFCEYMGVFGGVCMQPQARQLPDSELLRYCEMHLALVQRDRERAKRLRRPQMQGDGSPEPHDGRHPPHHHARRSRSEPYLMRSSSRAESDRDTDTRRVVVLQDGSGGEEAEESDTGTVQWTRSASSPAAFGQDRDRGTGHHAMNSIRERMQPALSQVRRKKIRVRKIVVPPRFEVLDGEPSTPPKVWYVRLAERVDGESGDPEDDEYIEVDDTDDFHLGGTAAASTSASAMFT